MESRLLKMGEAKHKDTEVAFAKGCFGSEEESRYFNQCKQRFFENIIINAKKDS